MCNIVDSYLRSSGSSNSVCKVTLQLPNIQHIGANILLTRFTNSKTTNPNIQFFAQLEHMWQVLKVLLLLSYLQKQSYSGFIVCLLDFVSKMPLGFWVWFLAGHFVITNPSFVVVPIKFRFFKKDIKIGKIFTVHLTLCSKIQIERWRFRQLLWPS